jgi:hypothetical protein
MKAKLFPALLALVCAVPPNAGFAAPGLPVLEGQCTRSTIASIGERLVDGSNNQPIAGSGSSVAFADGLVQLGYDELPQIARSRIGDPVLICLVLLPKDCPAGDDRGHVFTTTNLRLLESWTLANSEHGCGGA